MAWTESAITAVNTTLPRHGIDLRQMVGGEQEGLGGFMNQCVHGVQFGQHCWQCAQSTIYPSPPVPNSGSINISHPAVPDYSFVLGRIALALEGLLAKEIERTSKTA